MPIFANKYLRLALIAGVVILLDQVTKAVIVSRIPLNHAIEVIPGFFNIVHVLNPGGAFGFLARHSPAVRHLVFLVFSFVAVGFVIYFYFTTPAAHTFLSVAFALILGGAVGNLIDRIRFGRVVDFLDVYVGDLHWPAFNVADSAISVGVVIFVLHILFNKTPE